MKASSLGGGLGGFKQFLSISGPLAHVPLLATKGAKEQREVVRTVGVC